MVTTCQAEAGAYATEAAYGIYQLTVQGLTKCILPVLAPEMDAQVAQRTSDLQTQSQCL